MRKENKNVVVYHKNCMDGVSSAYIMKDVLEAKNEFNIEFIPLQYGESFKDAVGDNINKDVNFYFVDFSLQRKEMIELIESVNFVTVLDHHESAEKNLSKLEDQFDNCEIIFDMKRSGATLVFDTYNGLHKLDREIFAYIQDRDIWEWKLKDSKEVSEYLRLKVNPDDIESFGEVIKTPVSSMISGGQILDEATKKRVARKTNKIEKVMKVKIKGVDFLMLNATEDISEIGNAICNKYNIPAMMYFILQDTAQVVFSFRSLDSLANVSEIAMSLGGGGHPCASGATLPLDNLISLINTKEI